MACIPCQRRPSVGASCAMRKLKTRECDDKTRTRINEKFEGLTRLPHLHHAGIRDG